MNELTPEQRAEFEEQLTEVYARLSDINTRQRELNRELDEAEADRNVILIELGRIGVREWDVT